MPKAPRQCPTQGCTNLIRHTRYCPEHTKSWQGPRTESSKITSTSDWKKLRTEVLERDNYTCQIQLPGICIGHATHVDKVRPANAGGTGNDRNARAACKPCNEHKGRTTDKHFTQTTDRH